MRHSVNPAYLNIYAEDYGSLATATPRKVVKYYCKSSQCCKYLHKVTHYTEKTDDGRGQPRIYESYRYHNKVLVFETIDKKSECPTCGYALFSYQAHYAKGKKGA